jgi:transcriptional regulator with XRE-family HTH domain
MESLEKSRPSLASVIQARRHALDLSLAVVAEKSGVSLALLEQLEEGRLHFMSVMNRTRLTRVLKITPAELKQYETPPPLTRMGEVVLQSVDYHLVAHFNNGKRLPLREMERNAEGFWPCPDCGAELTTLTHLREDLEHKAWVVFKIRCTHCLFKLDHEAGADSL